MDAEVSKAWKIRKQEFSTRLAELAAPGPVPLLILLELLSSRVDFTTIYAQLKARLNLLGLGMCCFAWGRFCR